MAASVLAVLLSGLLLLDGVTLDSLNPLKKSATSTLTSRHDCKPAIIDVGYAKYQGAFNATSNVTRFLGIRFAQPPTGSLRFRAPKAPDNIAGIQDATTQPASCIQAETIGRGATNPYRSSSSNFTGAALIQRGVLSESESEDCLFVNVYFPGSTPPSNLPVVIYIHGGGYTQAQMSLFDGQDLVVESDHSVVSVLIQYRLGLFGFIAGQDVKEDGHLNVGLLDQDFALRWVQKHISKFGGDPNQVTIWGTSAGAGSVLQHVVANGGETDPPLFRGAIASSPFFPPQYRYDDPISEKIYYNIVSMANCSISSRRLDCLRQTDVQSLRQINSAINAAAFYGTYLMVPVVDSVFIRENPISALKEGKVNGHAILSTSNTFEGLNFVNQSIPATNNVITYAQELFPKMGINEASAIAAEYASIGSPLEQAVAIMNDVIFKCPGYFALTGLKRKGFKHAFRATYAVPPGRHGDDLPYYFTTGWTRTFPNPEFTRAFVESFMSFIISLNPNKRIDNASILPGWPSWDWIHNQREMIFNRTETNAPWIQDTKADSDLLKRCRFWDSMDVFIGQ